MSQNNLQNLNNNLFELIETLLDPEDETDYKVASEKAKLIKPIADTIINNARVQMDAVRIQTEYNKCLIENGYKPRVLDMPDTLAIAHNDKKSN